MSMLKVGPGNADVGLLDPPIQLYYEDAGHGPIVVLVHGWPLDHTMWNELGDALLADGCRVVRFDRRGFGRSSVPDGYRYSYDIAAVDLKCVLDSLDLRDVTLVGFSMGASEVVHYMSRALGQRVGRIALISSLMPSMVQGADSLTRGASLFRDIETRWPIEGATLMEQIAEEMLDDSSHRIDATIRNQLQAMILRASPAMTLACARAIEETDLTSDIQAIATVPALVIHGTEDRIATFSATGLLTASLLPDCVFKSYEGAPHALFATHAQQLNQDLLNLVHRPPHETL